MVCAVITALTPSPARPQEPHPPEAATPTTPSPGFERTFNVDATWGKFRLSELSYTDPKPDEPSGNLGESIC